MPRKYRVLQNGPNTYVVQYKHRLFSWVSLTDYNNVTVRFDDCSKATSYAEDLYRKETFIPKVVIEISQQHS
jgi:hypothetical protein